MGDINGNVNPLLAQGIYLRGYIEHVGSGTGDIIEKCRESGLPPPQRESEDDGLTVTLRRATISAQPQMSPQTDRGTTSETTLEKSYSELSATEMKIVSAIRRNPKITRTVIAAMLGITFDGVRYHLKALRGKLGLRHEGATKAGHWIFDK